MRLFVFPNAKAKRALAVFEVTNLTRTKATIASGVSLDSVRAGMMCCPGEGRKADRTKVYVVAEVQKSALVFEGAAPEPPPAEETKA